MRKHGGTPSGRDKQVTLVAISPPGVARGRFVGGQQSGLAGCKPPPVFTRGASSCLSQGRRQGEPWGASPQQSAPTYLPTSASPDGRRRCPWARSRGSRMRAYSRGLSGLPCRTPRSMWTGCLSKCAVAMRSLAVVWRKSRRSMTSGSTERWRRMRCSAPCGALSNSLRASKEKT